MTHPMSEQWMRWELIASAPDHGKPILVGFKGQFHWVYYVAPAFGDRTGLHMQYAPPTHWTPIMPPSNC